MDGHECQIRLVSSHLSPRDSLSAVSCVKPHSCSRAECKDGTQTTENEPSQALRKSWLSIEEGTLPIEPAGQACGGTELAWDKWVGGADLERLDEKPEDMHAMVKK